LSLATLPRNADPPLCPKSIGLGLLSSVNPSFFLPLTPFPLWRDITGCLSFPMNSLFSLLAQASPKGFLEGPFVMIVLMIIIFYFLLIRPQKKQRQEQEARIASLKKGDKVVTIGGMHGIVHHLSKETVTLKISEGVFVPFNKTAIASTESTAKGGKDNGEKDKAPADSEGDQKN
jgi:preprotein translocase subunit YajC